MCCGRCAQEQIREQFLVQLTDTKSANPSESQPPFSPSTLPPAPDAAEADSGRALSRHDATAVQAQARQAKAHAKAQALSEAQAQAQAHASAHGHTPAAATVAPTAAATSLSQAPRPRTLAPSDAEEARWHRSTNGGVSDRSVRYCAGGRDGLQQGTLVLLQCSRLFCTWDFALSQVTSRRDSGYTDSDTDGSEAYEYYQDCDDADEAQFAGSTFATCVELEFALVVTIGFKVPHSTSTPKHAARPCVPDDHAYTPLPRPLCCFFVDIR